MCEMMAQLHSFPANIFDWWLVWQVLDEFVAPLSNIDFNLFVAAIRLPVGTIVIIEFATFFHNSSCLL